MTKELAGHDGEVLTDEQLARLRDAQIQRLIDLKFHELREMSEDDYRASFPDILPQPDTYRGRFDIPLVVDPLIHTPQLTAAGIYGIDMHKLTNTVAVPRLPYTIWTSDVRKHRGRSHSDMMGQLAPDEVAGSLAEVVALYMQRPDLFIDFAVIAAGSRYHGFASPHIHTFEGNARIDPIFDISAFPNYGGLSRGAVINDEV